jgi:hypothetical protein
MTSFAYSALFQYGAICAFIVPLFQLILNKNGKGLRRITSIGWILLVIAIYMGVVNHLTVKAYKEEKTASDSINKQINDSLHLSINNLQSSLNKMPFLIAFKVDSASKKRDTILLTALRENHIPANFDLHGNITINNITISPIIHFTKQDGVSLLSQINSLKAEYNIESNTIEVAILMHSNAGIFVVELEAFLRQNGFTVDDEDGRRFTIGNSFSGWGAVKKRGEQKILVDIGML